jgi:hypothetical protein
LGGVGYRFSTGGMKFVPFFEMKARVRVLKISSGLSARYEGIDTDVFCKNAKKEVDRGIQICYTYKNKIKL